MVLRRIFVGLLRYEYIEGISRPELRRRILDGSLTHYRLYMGWEKGNSYYYITPDKKFVVITKNYWDKEIKKLKSFGIVR